jgi:prefoldin subunit 5
MRRSLKQLADDISRCMGRWQVITQYHDQIQQERREILTCLQRVRDELQEREKEERL